MELRPRLEPWSPGAAWISASVFCAISIMIGPLVTRSAFIATSVVGFFLSPLGSFLLSGLVYLWLLWVTVLFARVQTMTEFLDEFALRRPSRLLDWRPALAGFAAGLTVNYLSHVLARQPPRSLGLRFSLYGFTALLVPFFEEPIMRGYLYKAFRAKYSFLGSTLSVGLVFLLSHWHLVSRVPLAIPAILIMNTVMCRQRELSGSVWPPLMCHFFYNLAFAPTYLSGYPD
jgi:membrane protease YdiL (CAAX protease family)